MRRSCAVSAASGSFRSPARSRVITARQLRIQQRAAGGHRAHRADQVGPGDLLEQVARGPGHDRVEQRLVVGERGEHQAGQLRHPRTQFPAHRDPVAVRQPHVEHRDLRLERRHPGQRLRRGGRLADHLELALDLQQVLDPAPDHLVVVEQEHPDGRARAVVRRLRHDSTVGAAAGRTRAEGPENAPPSEVLGPPECETDGPGGDGACGRMVFTAQDEETTGPQWPGTRATRRDRSTCFTPPALSSASSPPPPASPCWWPARHDRRRHPGQTEVTNAADRPADHLPRQRQRRPARPPKPPTPASR